ncbi:arylsulfatase A-like enzyme [Jejuia pallidilutea]|uniref:Arylsulfatase A-like enzyme n=1 Tax=Jejuia pallidilutea TaxID=504487 RepID=A0A362X2Z1_9FLAO|nr:sulfatase [Jejuia pallidilutea]PQV48847.1 arylsulfatase A-like enzyme [Jejuia pallidilutea]
MNNKTVLSVILAFFLISCTFKKEDKKQTVTSGNRPNIIFLLCDDLRFDAVGYTGNSIIRTPHIDQLAEQGITFNNAYVTTSICAVSRASILSGQYARKHGIWGFSKNFSEEQLANTYPILLKESGYTIGFIGKYGVGHEVPEDKFDFWEGFNGQGSYKQFDGNGNPIHLTEKMGNQALEFLDKQLNKDAPFCLSVSFKAPHVEGDPGYFLPDEQFNHLYKDDDIPVPTTSSKEFFSHFPERFTKNNVARNRWESRFKTPKIQQENIKKYYRLISGVDKVVGRIMDALRESGQDENTVIIFTSDNGFYLGEYGFAGKWYGSDPSIRVPLVITDLRNKLNKSASRDEMVLNIDIAPTILGFANVKAPKHMQGKNIQALIEEPQMPWRNSFFYEHLWQSSERYYIPSTEGVVFKDKKYMTYFKDFDSENIVFEELYDTNVDINETNNLINNPEKDSLKNQMQIMLNKLKVAALK